jgi:hypothetical protein
LIHGKLILTGIDTIFSCSNTCDQMIRTARLVATLIFGSFISLQLSAQCVPDTVNCQDTGDPGQICPLSLPHAGLNVLYDEVVTIIPPGVYKILNSDLPIYYIEIDSVNNLPPGIDYVPGADKFFPDTAYCIQLTGIPTQTGKFELAIHIAATVDILGYPTRVPVVNDSSVVITVVEHLGVNTKELSEFQVFQNVPNPFYEMTRLGYYSPIGERIELSVYNILGVQVYHESDLVAPGEHYFRFDGRELQPGTYLYRVTTGKAYITGKLMKSR